MLRFGAHWTTRAAPVIGVTASSVATTSSLLAPRRRISSTKSESESESVDPSLWVGQRIDREQTSRSTVAESPTSPLCDPEPAVWRWLGVLALAAARSTRARSAGGGPPFRV
jgi:hypothetical protein